MSQRDTGQRARNWKLYATPSSTSHTRTHLQKLAHHQISRSPINPLKTKRRLLYLKTQSVPRC